MHEGKRKCDGDDDQQDGDAAKMKQITEQETRAEQNDSRLQPEFVGGDTGLEDAWDSYGVGDHQPDHDRPQNVFDIGKSDVVRLCVAGDGLLDELPGIAGISAIMRRAGEKASSIL